MYLYGIIIIICPYENGVTIDPMIKIVYYQLNLLLNEVLVRLCFKLFELLFFFSFFFFLIEQLDSIIVPYYYYYHYIFELLNLINC